MKQQNNYYKIKWTAFFLTVFVLGAGFAILFFLSPQKTQAPSSNSKNNDFIEGSTGHYSNESFGSLIETNLQDFGFIEDLSFSGEDEGQFSVQAKLTNTDRLITVFSELSPYEALLTALEGETIQIKGHIGESADGNGCFITDTITFSNYTIPAAAATTYIEKYTDLNSLLSVPFQEITISESGVTFASTIPEFIQTVSYK